MHIVHTEASMGWGGQEIRILTEAAGMMRRGHRVSLLCPASAKIFSEAQRRGIPVFGLPFTRKRLAGVRAAYRWLKRERPDVINTHSSTDSWLMGLACLFLPAAPPIVRTRHISAPIPRNLSSRWLYQRSARHIATTGEKLRAQLIHDNGFDPATLTSVPTGIDTEQFQPGDRAAARDALDLPQDQFIFGIAATLRSWKGHRYLLDAFARIAAPNTLLLIVGDGPQRAALETQIRTLDIDARVRMVGDRRDVAPWLQAMDTFVLPSYANEGVPQALMQAMLTRLPIITTAVGSITEIIQHEASGLIVAPENVEALAAAMQRVLIDPDLRQRLASAAYEHAHIHCGLKPMLDRMETIFTQVLRGAIK